MTERNDDNDINAKPSEVNPGYAIFQIAKALVTSEDHDDPATRERAKEKISKWESVLNNILSGSVSYGSRTPIKGIPGWATPEVVTGGFATGALLAGGPLHEHENKLLENLGSAEKGDERRALNAYFLTDAGLAELREQLRTACYDVRVPEEGALMVVAWLVENGHTEAARDLISELSPYFAELRFYPIPLDHPRQFGSRVHIQDVGSTIGSLRNIEPNEHILAQKEAVKIWAPLYDRIVALFLETVENDWPCKNYPAGWSKRALALLGEYHDMRTKHKLCGKPERARGHFAQLREFLARCAKNPEALTGREVGRIRLILNRHVEKHGAPDSSKLIEHRRRQQKDVSAATFHEIAGVVIPRLENHSKSDGLDDMSHLVQAVSKEESPISGIPEGTLIPASIQRKVERCLNETVTVLVERGLITSGEALAQVLPQMTSGLRASAISDPALRRLYAAIYQAFRRRRSLLLLNLESQIRIEELPWVAAIDQFRSENLSSRELAKQALEEVTILTITSFPYVILPNKLLQELRALIKTAELNIILVDEVAADIFMGEFSGKFLESAKRAADLLDGSLYATYYGIDYKEVRRLPEIKEKTERKWFWPMGKAKTDDFVHLCSSRAGVSIGTGDPAINGMIIEQQQILTTQNLAALFMALDLTDALRDQLDDLARECFRWICKRHQMKIDKRHARLIMVKNTAYAWRQMIFFLALLTDQNISDFLQWTESHLNEQQEEFRARFRPALKGLMIAASGNSIDSNLAKKEGGLRYLGWSKTKHWLLTDA